MILQLLGATLRYCYNSLFGDYKPFSSYFLEFKIYTSENVKNKTETEAKNGKVGFYATIVLLIVIFISLNW